MRSRPPWKGLPHTRGGVSRSPVIAPVLVQSSPHPWGCFRDRYPINLYLRVFPTPVGVFLDAAPSFTMACRLPHTRGGVSNDAADQSADCKSSPHPWGCFYAAKAWGAEHEVFPTPVGVFLMLKKNHDSNVCLPHTRGGVSPDTVDIGMLIASSPHPWGCFL